MDENRVEGTIRKAAGKVQEGVGPQDLYGQVEDSASELVRSTGDALGKFIKEQPYTATLIALGIGWLLGRTHRPL
jgi:ElaB/YqjD/DUF883 family membrane-anchored ribosome-binding protein